jgi:hypothetical protein
MSAIGAVAMHESFSASAGIVRSLVPDELLELLEGPREEKNVPEVRLKCRATKDGAEGWMTVRGSAGENASESKDFYVCKSTIAMTDVSDLKTCKVLKKVVAGEVLQVTETESQDKDLDMGRLKFRSTKDGKEGWVTVKGNQGTIYLELSDSYYRVDKATNLVSAVSVDSIKVRELSAGEAVESLAAPIEQRPETKLGLRARAHTDGKIGWVLFSAKAGPPPVKPCSPKL